MFRLSSHSILARFGLIFCLALHFCANLSSVRALEESDLLGFWAGTIQELDDEGGNPVREYEITWDILPKEGGGIEVLEGFSAYFQWLKNFSVEGDRISYDWTVGKHTQRLDHVVSPSNEISFEFHASPVDPWTRINLRKIPVTDPIPDDDLTGKFSGQLVPALSPPDFFRIKMDLDLSVDGDEISADLFVMKHSSPAGAKSNKEAKLSFGHVERYGNRLHFYLTPEQRLQDCQFGNAFLAATASKDGLAVVFWGREISGTGLGNLARPPEDPSVADSVINPPVDKVIKKGGDKVQPKK